MGASMSKAIIGGLPHSGKTSKLIELFLQSLGERPDERRVMIVPDASHRDYLRTVIMQRGGLQALRESEVVTLAEFLRSLAEQAELVNGQRITSLEELLAFRRIIRGLNETGEADIPLTLAAARLVKHTVEALRNAGLLLKLLPGNETPKLPARGAVGLKAAVRHFEAMKSTQRYDGLLAQEMAVLALQDRRCVELLPELILVDGFCIRCTRLRSAPSPTTPARSSSLRQTFREARRPWSSPRRYAGLAWKKYGWKNPLTAQSSSLAQLPRSRRRRRSQALQQWWPSRPKALSFVRCPHISRRRSSSPSAC